MGFHWGGSHGVPLGGVPLCLMGGGSPGVPLGGVPCGSIGEGSYCV